MYHIHLPYNQNTLVNFSNSILKKYHVGVFHDTNKEIDLLIKDKRKIVLILFDGLGSYILEKYLSKDSFLLSHQYTKINSTFPPTTVAATNAFLSGKYPFENGWLGWSQYIKSENKVIDVFINKVSGTDTKLPLVNGQLINEKLNGYEDIFTLIRKNNPSVYTFNSKEYPCDLNGHHDINDAKNLLDDALKNDDVVGYIYFTSPDHELHSFGVGSKEALDKILEFQNFVKEVSTKHEDTLFLTFADHGLINCKYLNIEEHKDLLDCLKHRFSIEGRSPCFEVKKGKKKLFKQLFNKYYGDKFVLYSKKDVYKLKLFGEGIENEHFSSSIGDFIAFTHQKYAFYYKSELKPDDNLLIGHHGGGSKEEQEITICAFNN
ncbi:MAG: alkaline phosphatase family protein [Bacilli bacterium]